MRTISDRDPFHELIEQAMHEAILERGYLLQNLGHEADDPVEHGKMNLEISN